MQAYDRRTALAALGSCSLLAFAPRLAAQPVWPSKPITLIVPFAAGVSPDVVARLLADKMGQALGQPIIVDNRAGASGIIGAELAAKAPADGNTLFLPVESILGVLPHIYAKLRYDPFRDFVPVTQVAYGPFYLVTSPDQPFKTLAAMQLTRAAEFVTVEHLADAIQDYIRYYNEERIKAKLGTSPVSFRAREVAA